MGFYGFVEVFYGLKWVTMVGNEFCGFVQVFLRLRWVFTELEWVHMDLSRFCWVKMSLTGWEWVSMGSLRFSMG